MESSLVTSVGALIVGGGATAVFWKALQKKLDGLPDRTANNTADKAKLSR